VDVDVGVGALSAGREITARTRIRPEASLDAYGSETGTICPLGTVNGIALPIIAPAAL
jgi:hypothetical protein